MDTEQDPRRQPPPETAAAPPRIDLGPVAQAVGRELGGVVPAERIEALLQQLLEQEFCDVRVTTFVPIFLQRSACETLRRQLPPRSGSRP